MKRLLRILDFVLTAVLVLLIVASTYLAIAAKKSFDAIPTVMGTKILTVLSGSMVPTIRTGDVIGVRPLATGETAREGDIITYRVPGNSRMLITHRVMGIVSVNGKPTAYVTKGDANDSQDPSTVAVAQVVGRFSWRVPLLGYVTDFIRKPLGIILVVIVPGLVLIGMELRKLWRLTVEIEAAKTKGDNPSQRPSA